MRNPIVFGVFLFICGSFLIIPNILNLFLLVINIVVFDSKTRAEEKFLSARFGEKYDAYRKKVRRYFPLNKKGGKKI